MSAWKLWLGVLGAGLSLMGALALWVYHATQTAWSQFGTEIDRLIEAEAQRTPARPHLRPSSGSGNAWPDYLLAIEAVKPLQQRNSLLAYWTSPTPQNHIQTIQTLEAHAKTLELFHHATLAARLSPTRLPEDLREYRRLHEGWLLAMLALADARVSLDKGESGQGTDRLIDLLQFTRDWVECGGVEKVRTSNAYVRDTVLEFARALEGGRVGPAEVEKFSKALQILDEHSPSRGDALRRRVIQLGAALHTQGISGVSGAGHGAPGLRDFYSERRLVLRLFLEARALLQAAREIDEWSWTQEKEFFRIFQAQFPIPPAHLNTEFDHLCYMMRLNQAWVRLGRVALHWKLTGTVLSLQDPLGSGPLNMRILNNRLEVWSVGYAGNQGPDDPHSMVYRVAK